MNDRMYPHPATQANLALLRDAGRDRHRARHRATLASHGEHGVGRLAEPAELLGRRARPPGRGAGSGSGSVAGVRVLVTAGGTREPIDSVRYIGNRSCGRMGFALAERAAAPRRRGHPGGRQRRAARAARASASSTSRPPPSSAACDERFDACRRPADGRRGRRLPARAARPPTSSRRTDRRPARSSSNPPRTCSARWRRDAAPARCWSASPPSTGDGAVDYARGKLERKRLDAIVVNDISRPGIGFDAADNEVTILASGRREHRLRQVRKEQIADGVLDEVEQLASRRRQTIEPSEQTPLAPQESEAFAAVGRALTANINKAVQVRPETLVT